LLRFRKVGIGVNPGPTADDGVAGRRLFGTYVELGSARVKGLEDCGPVKGAIPGCGAANLPKLIRRLAAVP